MSRRIVPILLVLCVAISAPLLRAQTTTTGELTGVVTDPSGAVLTNAAVTLTSTATGAKQTTQSNTTGTYRFPLLQPGSYKVSASANGFQAVEKTVDIGLGASVSANLQLALGGGHETVEVSGAVTTVETEDANLNTNFAAKQVELLPNPGNDLSAVALTAPGAVMNTAGGSQFGGGNFEVYGLPATSNLFTVDGSNYNDPYFNVNNSGATNLTLGLNDVQESAVVANGYSGSYGGLAGANINYVSKSGANQFHGNLEYWWNGTVLNANEYFRNQHGEGRAPVNANQFAGSIGGPIKKDKAFFFFDYEGLYLAIPSPVPVNVPTAAFQGAVTNYLNNSGQSASLPFYNQAFSVYNRVSQAAATQLGGGIDPATGNPWSGGGCNDVTTASDGPFAGDAAFQTAFANFGHAGGAPCAVNVAAAASAHTHDVFYAGRYDMNLTSRDKMFIRVEHEHGLQATFTDPFASAFNAISDQPQWQSNFQETHTFGTDKINSFNASLLWYSAGFSLGSQANANAALTGLPNSSLTLSLNDGSLSALNADNFLLPQGRKITQYQFVDDFSWVRGRHTFRVGANYRRDDITDQNFIFVTPLVLPLSLGAFASGGAGSAGSIIVQNFPSKLEEPIALYQLGVYGSDDIRVTNNLKLTLSLRLEHLSNPVCQNNCFQHLAGTFGTLNTSAAVNTAIIPNQHTAFPSVTAVVPQPKIGFAWSPFGGARATVIRGGVGIFADALPTGAIDNFMAQAPLDPQFVSGGPVPLSPAQPGNVFTASQAANASFQSNYASGGAVAPFSFYNATAVKVPRYYEWSLEVQQGLGWNSTMSVMYVGNHGTHEEISNTALNAFSPTPFADLPASAPDPRFGVVSQQQNIANSNYSGLVVTAKHNFRGGLTFQAGYTWSHALDEISNNSLSPFGLNVGGFYADIINPQDPFNIRKYNYGNADYDIRHNFTANYVWSDGLRHLTNWGPAALMKGWSFSGTLFRHSGLPFTVVSSATTGLLEGSNYGPGGGTQQVFADVLGPSTGSCGGSAALINPDGTAKNPCLLASNFGTPSNNWGQQRRNQFRGPGYFDTDFAVEKAFVIPKWEAGQFSLGARFFNIFNHPDFYFPVNNLNNVQFGQVIQTISSPTSIYGSGLGANASPRLIQLQAKFTF